MQTTMTSKRASWIAAGLISGLAIAYLMPHEPTYATMADRESQFMMVTVPLVNQAAGANDALDAVFIVDFVTGQLKGAAFDPKTEKFNKFWVRDLAKDFAIPGGANRHFCIVSGHAQLPVVDGATFASGVIYVGEWSTGKVSAYSIPWKAGQLEPLKLLDSIPFRVGIIKPQQ